MAPVRRKPTRRKPAKDEEIVEQGDIFFAAGYKHMRGPDEPVPVLQGSNSLVNVGSDGPQGTVGRIFRYRIRLLALDTPIETRAGLDRKAFDKAIDGHVLGEAELHAVYERR